ncbi:MAG: S8 family serine peptidase [Marmoricola sp.]
MTRRQWATGLVGAVVVAGTTTLVPTTATTAATPPVSTNADPALGNGLGRLLAASERPSLKQRAGLRINQERLTIRDAQDRVLVHLTPQSNVNRAAFRKQAEALGMKVQAVDADHGTLEGFVPLSAARKLAALRGTGTLVQALKPETRVGAATSQGVALERANRVHARGVNGKGITIGALSDSYDAATLTIPGDPLTVHAAQDVASGDLPGKGNPRNSQPVVVLEDLVGDQTATDEGRAMLQIAHDVAPGSKLCFATAIGGLLHFADNIRRLADKKGKCGADVVVDDVGYFEEPFFSDSALSDAIDEVAAKGTHYFTSAGNDGVAQSWNSKVRLLPAKNAVKGTNIDLSEVDPALYDGGLQDMNPGRGTDIAQSIALGDGGILNVQWNDPVDVDGATIGAPIFTGSGEITAADPEPSLTFDATAAQVGQTVLFRTDAIPSGSTDLILTVTAPDGTEIGSVDTGSSPEVLGAKLTQAGTYTITISGFDGDTGDFTVDVSPVISPSRVTTDFNLLIFDGDGAYLGSIADLNPLSGRPQEIVGLDPIPDVPEIQLVISRAGTGPVGATRLQHVMSGDPAMTEYADPLSSAMTGHTMAKGATAVAAYDPFRPFLPEPYTSPGGDIPVYFDSSGNRFDSPQIRRVPQVAGADRGNTTFFVADDLRDADTQPNFGGTSASAPHVASIAALALQKAGGGKSYTPKALRTRLQESTFKHDLDPMVARGRAQGLTVVAKGAQGNENYTIVPQSMVDPKFFTLHYAGKVPVTSVTFYGETASPTALGKANPPLSDGIVFDPRPFDGETPFRTDGFPFTIGATYGGLARQKVKASFSVPGGGESVKGQFRRMTLTFKSGLKKGQTLQFGVDRDLAISGFGGANEGNGADELGGAVFLPQNLAASDGLDFSARLANGRTIRGTMVNRLGHGYTPVDGYGLVNAEEAALGR